MCCDDVHVLCEEYKLEYLREYPNYPCMSDSAHPREPSHILTLAKHSGSLKTLGNSISFPHTPEASLIVAVIWTCALMYSNLPNSYFMFLFHVGFKMGSLLRINL